MKRRRQAIEWKKIFVKGNSVKGLLSKIYEELFRANNTKLDYKWAKDMNRYLTKEDIQLPNNHMKRCLTSYFIGNLKIKTRYHYTSIRIVKIQNPENHKPYRGYGATRMLIYCLHVS